jgi:hypothetical protein
MVSLRTQLCEIHLMAVKIGPVNTGELGLAAHGDAAAPPHMPVPSIMTGLS